jgi:signal transduction histidine kinase
VEIPSSIDSNKVTLIEFLDNHKSEFLNEWHKSINVNGIDLYNEKIKENGSLMYSLIEKAVGGSLSELELKQLAYKIAKERLEADINIGDFVYNVNLGRSIMVKHVLQSKIPLKNLQTIVEDINNRFDQFCFHAVTRYTNLKNQELEDQKLFISENHKDKLAILGQISSSFVHEFRNPLTAIIGFNKLLRNENPDLKYIDIIEHELHQLNFRITQFLHTSKAEINDKQNEEISIQTLFHELQPLIYPSIVDIDVNLASKIDGNLVIVTNKDELKQVLLNLLINSIDALKEQEKPRNMMIDCYRSEEEIIINISNNGPAIETEFIKAIFEPFFTTKELGTGIGLFVCKKIIEKHGGYITCQSFKDLTTFSIHLPNTLI